MNMLLDLFKKYYSLISYAFFGVLTTVVNIVSYYLFYNILEFSNVISNCIAWFLAVVFAYITNKLFVFDSKSFKIKILIAEITSFFVCRILTGVLDVGIMYFAVDVFDLNSTLWKVISNIIVIVLNYVASKLFIFKKNIKKVS